MIGHPNLVLWSKFEGDAKNFAGTGDGTLVGSPSFVAEIFGQGLSLNGSSQWVTYGDILDLGTGDYTIATIFKTSGTVANQMIITKVDGNYPDWDIYISSTGKIHSRCNVGLSNRKSVKTLASYNDGIFHSITTTVIRATESIMIYVDGALITTEIDYLVGTIATGSLDNPASLHIGSRDIPASRIPFNGGIGDTLILKGVAVGAQDARRIHYGIHPLTRS